MATVNTGKRGRPRSEEARRAILRATLELAAEDDPRRLSMDAIARRAGVSKETLYRWWRSKTDVVLEALAERGEETIPLTDTGSLVGDLRLFLRATAAAVDPTTLRLLRTLAAAAADDTGFAHLVRDRFIARRRAAVMQILERGVARGELRRADVLITTDLVYGSLWYRIIFDIAPLDDSWADAVARAVAPRRVDGDQPGMQ